ncbi:MAG: hypothetical protein LJE68_07795 [Rhodobacter sp.]|nr:hypothetical protein [Rhodobacter sp.]
MLGAAFVAGSGVLGAQGEPLDEFPIRIGNFETANTLPGRTYELNIGSMQTDPNQGTGTGNQTYFGGGSYAVNDRLSFGFDMSSYQDPPAKPINGLFPDFVLNTAAAWAKYKLYDGESLAISAQGSAETFVRLESPVFGGRHSNVVIGSLKLPITYEVSPKLQFHLTPGVSVFPDTVGGMPFYGTIASVGAGVTYKPSNRLAFFGAINAPVFGGTNTVSNTATLVSQPVWSVGGRYNVTPKAAIHAFLTNGVGTTPATSILTHWPDGDMVLAGLQIVYTPGARYSETYRGPVAPVTARQVSLQNPGFTIGSADVMEPGVFQVSGWYGTQENAGGSVSLSPGRDGQVDLIFEDYADDGSVAAKLVPTTKVRYMFGPKLRVLDQNNGDPFSLSGRLLYGRQIEPGIAGVGVFYLEGMASYKVNDRLALTASPKIAAFGNTEVLGLGLGVNYELFNGLELIAEATAVGADATDPVWAAGLRYNLAGTGLSIDAHASNAIGRQGVGSMIAQDSTKFSISLTKQFAIPRWNDVF